MKKVKTSKKFSFGGGEKAKKLIHISDNPHFKPEMKSADDVQITIKQRWSEIIDNCAESKVYFEIIKGTAQDKNLLGLVKELNINDSKKIIYRGKEPYFRYEFFVINEEGRKLWSSGPQSLKGDDDSNDDNHLGWCDIRIDPQQLVPWKYSYTETNERPCIYVTGDFKKTMKHPSLAKIIYYSFLLKVLGDHIYKGEDAMRSKWFGKIFDEVNTHSTRFDGEDEPLEAFIESDIENQNMWLYDVSEGVFRDNDGENHIEQLANAREL